MLQSETVRLSSSCSPTKMRSWKLKDEMKGIAIRAGSAVLKTKTRTWKSKDEMKGRTLLDVVIREGTAVLKLVVNRIGGVTSMVMVLMVNVFTTCIPPWVCGTSTPGCCNRIGFGRPPANMRRCWSGGVLRWRSEYGHITRKRNHCLPFLVLDLSIDLKSDGFAVGEGLDCKMTKAA